MRRHAKHLGHRQRDILDTLRAGPLTTPQLQVELGCANRAPLAAALRKLHRAGLVSRRAGPGRGQVLEWTLTPLGDLELQIRERVGYAPGAAPAQPIWTKLSAAYTPRRSTTTTVKG